MTLTVIFITSVPLIGFYAHVLLGWRLISNHINGDGIDGRFHRKREVNEDLYRARSVASRM